MLPQYADVVLVLSIFCDSPPDSQEEALAPTLVLDQPDILSPVTPLEGPSGGQGLICSVEPVMEVVELEDLEAEMEGELAAGRAEFERIQLERDEQAPAAPCDQEDLTGEVECLRQKCEEVRAGLRGLA